MQAVALVLGAWALFGGTHVALAASRVRAAFVARFGNRAFVFAFSAVAWLCFTGLVAGYASVQAEGPPGPALGSVPWVRGALSVVVVVGVVFMVAATGAYFGSPIAVFVDTVRPARGLERITRHPFFSGIALIMGAHALLATHLTGTVFFAGFVALAVFGPMHQKKKLVARYGAELDAYLASTSAIPFLAIARGRQRLVAGELPWVTLPIGLLAAYGLHRGHAGIFAWHGAPMIAVVVAGTVVISVVASWRASRTPAARSS